MIDLLISLGVNSFLIILIGIMCYIFREAIKNFFSEKLLEKQEEHNSQRDKQQNEFQEKLLRQNSELQQKVLAAIENQKKEIQKELSDIDYKRDYYKKIVDSRLNAYATLERFSIDISCMINLCGKDNILLYWVENKMLSGITSKFDEADMMNLWYSDDIKLKLNEINRLLTALQKAEGSEANNNGRDFILSSDMSSQNAKICQYVDDLRTIMFKDMQNLYDVEGFFNK